MPTATQLTQLVQNTTALVTSFTAASSRVTQAAQVVDQALDSHLLAEDPHTQYVRPPIGQSPVFLEEGVEGGDSFLLTGAGKGIAGLNAFWIRSDPLVLELGRVLFNAAERFQIALHLDPADEDTYVRLDLSFDGGNSFVNLGTFNKSTELLWVTEEGETSPTHILTQRVLGSSTLNQLVLKV